MNIGTQSSRFTTQTGKPTVALRSALQATQTSNLLQLLAWTAVDREQRQPLVEQQWGVGRRFRQAFRNRLTRLQRGTLRADRCLIG